MIYSSTVFRNVTYFEKSHGNCELRKPHGEACNVLEGLDLSKQGASLKMLAVCLLSCGTDVGELSVITRPRPGANSTWGEGFHNLAVVGMASGGTITWT